MIGTKDIFHLPILDEIIHKWHNFYPSITLVAGFDIPKEISKSKDFLPQNSGRAGFFRVLAADLLNHRPEIRAVNIAPPENYIRFTRSLAKRIRKINISEFSKTGDIKTALKALKPDLVIMHELNNECLPILSACAENKISTIAQCNTPLQGQKLSETYLPPGLDFPAYFFSVSRIATLCPDCRKTHTPSKELLEKIPIGFSDFYSKEPEWHIAPGCPNCKETGKRGEVNVFDIHGTISKTTQLHSLQSEQNYLLSLASEGVISLQDALEFHQHKLNTVYWLYKSTQEITHQTSLDLDKLELQHDISNLVLQNRTEALFTLQEMSTSLANDVDLVNLANKINKKASDISGAESSLLYLLKREIDQVEIIGQTWGKQLISNRISLKECQTIFPLEKTIGYTHFPPGIPAPKTKDIHSGLAIPLLVDSQQVGVLLIQSQKKLVFSHNEIAILRAIANHAALVIQRQALIEDMVEKERIEKELELAHDVQQSVLPKTFPKIPGVDISAHNTPARQVGGDFYDIFKQEGNKLGFVIGDVSDKGLPAALYMTLTKSLVLAESKRSNSPAKVLTDVNNLLAEIGNEKAFISLFYGVVDLNSNQLTYARAGHDYPLLLRDNRVIYLQGNGTVLGVFENTQFTLEEQTLSLHPGDKIILYTDGIIDCSNIKNERFGLVQFKEIVTKNAHRKPQEISQIVLEKINSFQQQAPQFDDITLVIIEIS